MPENAIAQNLTYYVVLLFSLSFHESAHAWAALRMGDDTAAREGRISMNPLVHIDPVGTVLMPLLQILMSGFPMLAWAKPTPYNPANFRRDVSLGRGHVIVAAAGPVSNLILGGLFTVLLFGAARTGLIEAANNAALMVLAVGIQLNVLLAIFNLVPLPPLDGSKVASFGLPRSIAERYDAVVESFGPWLLLILLIPVSRLLAPIYILISTVLIRLALAGA